MSFWKSLRDVILGTARPEGPLMKLQEWDSIPLALKEEYLNTLVRLGPDHPDVAVLRSRHSAVPHFPSYAEAMDDLKRAVGGSGIDWPPSQQPINS